MVAIKGHDSGFPGAYTKLENINSISFQNIMYFEYKRTLSDVLTTKTLCG